MGSRPSSRRAAIRLTRLIPNRCRPAATPRRGAWGSRRFRHSGQVRAMQTCSVTSAGDTGSSMTSRVRCTQPPLRAVWHSGQNSGSVDYLPRGFHPRPGKAVGALPAGLLFFPRRLLAPGGWFVARHPGSRPAAGQPGFQVLHPPAQFGDNSLLFHDNRQQSFPARLVQVQPCFHCPFMPQLRPGRHHFSTRRRASPNSPHQV